MSDTPIPPWDQYHPDPECPHCEGRGWYIETGSEHGCGGDEARCAIVCPVPVPIQVGCECGWPQRREHED